MRRIQDKLSSLEKENDEGVYIMLLLKGVCLRNYGRHEEAIACFQQILDAEKKDIKEFTYIPPHAALEIGLSYLDVGKLTNAKHWLLTARDHYSGFLVESLVHLRIHGALCQIRRHKAEE